MGDCCRLLIQDFGFCPMYRPESNGCHDPNCSYHKTAGESQQQESSMEEFHWIAIASNNSISTQCKTREEAVKWAEQQMSTKHTLNKVLVYAVQAVVEREHVPIVTRNIPIRGHSSVSGIDDCTTERVAKGGID